jgi:hypothetical protein
MNKLSKVQSAYIAGFLDADGSIYVKLTKNSTYKYHYQVSSYIVFYQSLSSNKSLSEIQQILGIGYLRKRNDGIEEFIIGDTSSIKEFVKQIKPFLIYKQKQADLILKILDQKEKTKSAEQFLALCELIDQFKELNYSKKRTVLTEVVKVTLKNLGLLTP